MQLRLLLLVLISLMSGQVLSYTFYTDRKLPNFSKEEQSLLDEINLEFAPLKTNTKVGVHNKQMKKLIAEHGENWHKNLVESIRKINNDHGTAFAQLTRKTYLETKNGHVEIVYCTNGMICQRTVTKDMLNGGSNRAYFKHKITEYHYDQNGDFERKRTYEKSGSMCCFVGTTLVAMASGESRPIREVGLGDSVLTYDFERDCFVETTVKEVTALEHEELVKLTFDNVVIYATADHPFRLANNDWAAINPGAGSNYFEDEAIQLLEVGDTLCYYNEDGLDYTVLESVEFVEGTTMTYTINELEKGNTFVANGLLVGVEYLPLDHPLRSYLSAVRE